MSGSCDRMGGRFDERVDAEEPVGFGRVGFEAGRFTTQFDHDAVRIEVVQRMAPAMVLLHRRLDTLGRHPGSHGLLLLGSRSERAVVDPERQPDTVGHVGGPARLLTDLVEPVSIDEAFMDLAGTERLHGMSAAKVLARFAAQVESKIGITVSIRLASTSNCKGPTTPTMKPEPIPGLKTLAAPSSANWVRAFSRCLAFRGSKARID